jgi:hypothetical protein
MGAPAWRERARALRDCSFSSAASASRTGTRALALERSNRGRCVRAVPVAAAGPAPCFWRRAGGQPIAASVLLRRQRAASATRTTFSSACSTNSSAHQRHPRRRDQDPRLRDRRAHHTRPRPQDIATYLQSARRPPAHTRQGRLTPITPSACSARPTPGPDSSAAGRLHRPYSGDGTSMSDAPASSLQSAAYARPRLLRTRGGSRWRQRCVKGQHKSATCRQPLRGVLHAPHDRPVG